MVLSKRNCAFLLVFVAAVCLELYQAQHIVGRCRCPSFSRIYRPNITDFQVYEPCPRCDSTEVILTRIKLDNSTEKLCIHPRGKIAVNLIKCWERINKEESRKMECIERMKRPQEKTSED
ncbi:hypothetical protein GOODEAATRI_027794 [Goodea atripinnis]|uniref:Chemokine interleukin-8-like domain-containing protein n=1 Tax=Goodea atripinnis TaxID=208336 RepID=A0ABV0PHL0_9TELE